MENWKNENPVIVEDIASIASDTHIPWEDFSGCTILVTGATGLIGSLVVKSLLYCSEMKGFDLQVVACVRTLEKARKVFIRQQDLLGRTLHFLEHDVSDVFPLEVHADYVIHTAAPTASADFTERPVETIHTIIAGMESVLELAKRSRSRSVVSLSTMEVYGRLEREKVTEKDSGYLDPLVVRNSYPQSKRVAEAMCAAYASEYGVPVKIVRLTQTFGPGVSLEDNRVFMQFARAVMQEKDIVLHTEGGTKRDYLYTADAVRGIFSVLLLGDNGEAYNLSNPESYVSILEMANMCASLSKGNIRILFDCTEANQKHYLSEIHITLDEAKTNTLNDFRKVPLYDMFERLIRSFEN